MPVTILERPSPHFDSRHGAAIDCLVIHDTECRGAESALSWFESPQSKASAHYVIDVDGTAYRCVPEEARAWHAGSSVIDGRGDVNTYSIGIALVDFATSPYTAAQLEAVAALCADLCLRYKIAVNRIVGHQDIAVPAGRKSDPGGHFPWDDIRRRVAAAVARRPA